MLCAASPVALSVGRGRGGAQGFQTAGTFLETNSALLANTLALDKLSEFDGTEVRGGRGDSERRRDRGQLYGLAMPWCLPGCPASHRPLRAGSRSR